MSGDLQPETPKARKIRDIWIFVACLALALAAVLVGHMSKFNPLSDAPAAKDSMIGTDTSQQASSGDDATGIEQVPETECIVSNARSTKQSDGSVITSFRVSAANPAPDQQLYVQVSAPGLLPVTPSHALMVNAPPPLLFSSQSIIQGGSASTIIHPPQGKYEIVARLARPAKIFLDCKVM